MSKLIRTTHRWLGMILIVLTLINIVAFSIGQVVPALYYSPLAPLFLLMLSGLYMFFLPYVRKARAG